MKLSTLKVKVTGPLWRFHEFEIEGIELVQKMEFDNESGWVEVKDFALSPDDILDIYIKIGAPNGTGYKLEVTGVVTDGSQEKEFSFSKSYQVERNGRLRIIFQKKITL